MIQVAIDSNGYTYSIDDGYLINVGYDDFGNPIDVETGEQIQYVRIDPATTQNGSSRPIYTDISDDVKDVLVAIFGNENQRFSGNRIPIAQAPSGTPILTTPRSMIGVGAGASVSPGGIGGSLNVSTNTLILLGLGVAVFFLGKGRR